MDHWYEFLCVNPSFINGMKRNGILRNAEEKAEMWIYISSRTISNEYQTDTRKFSDLTTTTEPLATNVTVQQFTIIQNAHEKCLADGQPNNTITIRTGSSSAVERDPGENMAEAWTEATSSEQGDDIQILPHPWWTTPGRVYQPHSSTEFGVRDWQKGWENCSFVGFFFNWQILHTEYNHQKRYVCLWNVDRLLQNLTWRRNRVGARQWNSF